MKNILLLNLCVRERELEREREGERGHSVGTDFKEREGFTHFTVQG